MLSVAAGIAEMGTISAETMAMEDAQAQMSMEMDMHAAEDNMKVKGAEAVAALAKEGSDGEVNAIG